MNPWLSVIGVGEEGVAALPPQAREALEKAKIVLGPERFLQGLTSDQQRVAWTPPLTAMLKQIKARRGTPTAILATGDPLWFGIGATLTKHLDAAEFTVHPHPSAFQLAAARLHWPLQHVTTLSLHGRPEHILHPHLTPGQRILMLTSDRSTAARVIEILLARGYDESRLIALENLGGAAERVRSATARTFDLEDLGDFYVLGLDCVADPDAPLLPPIPGLPDGAFISDGQLTKREVRAVTLAKLAPFAGGLLWDVGAGCGSVAIEWMRSARDSQAVAFEVDDTRIGMIRQNADALGVPGLGIISGRAPESFSGQAKPDAVFLGGGVGDETLFEACWSALKRGGRFVANAVTLDGEEAIYRRQDRLGGEIARIEVSVLDRIGGHRVMRPRMAVTQWVCVKS